MRKRKRNESKNTEKEVKAILLKGLSEGMPGKEWAIPIWEGKNFVFDKLDMVNAIWKIRKRK